MPKVAMLITLAAISIATVSCDPGHTITYVNETNEFVEIYFNGRFSLSLEPMQTRKLEEIMFFGRVTYEARDVTGRVLYRDTFTWEELKEAGWRIVITEEATIPTP